MVFFCKSPFIFYLLLKDLNIFSEKKTNLGLFFLNDNLNIHFYIKGKDFIVKNLFLKNLKLYLLNK